MTTAAIYVRVSKNRDDDKAKPERQIERCLAAAKAQKYDIVTRTDKTHFVDDDVSAYAGGKTKRDRPAYDAMMEVVRKGEVQVIVALHMDRVTRSLKEMLAFIELAKATGVRLVTVESGDLDLNTSAGRMMAQMLALVAQTESERKAERHQLRNAHAAANGLSIGMAGFGYGEDEQREDHNGEPVVGKDGKPSMVRKETGRLHLEEGPLLKEAIQRVLNGETIHGICTEWNQKGVLTRQGKQWAHTQLRRVLLRPRNAGYVVHEGKIKDGVVGKWETACTPEEFERIKLRLKTNTRRREPRKHLMTGLLMCQKCDHPMEASVSTRTQAGVRYSYPVYRCKHANGIDRTFCGITYRQEKADKFVINAVRSLLMEKGEAGRVMGSPDLKQAMLLRDERGRLWKRLDDIEKMMKDGEYSVAGYRAARTDLNAEIEAIEAQVAEIEQANAVAKMMTERIEGLGGQSIEASADVQKRFNALSLDERRQIVKQCFSRIEISPFAGDRDPLARLHFTRADGTPFTFSGPDEHEDENRISQHDENAAVRTA